MVGPKGASKLSGGSTTNPPVPVPMAKRSEAAVEP